MVDVKKLVVASLKEILPTYYELFVDSSTPLPCITYRVVNDSDDITTRDAGTSNVTYAVKVWGNAVGNLTDYMTQIDDAMRELGFIRISYNELAVDNQLCLIGNYEGLCFEIFKEEI